MSPSPECLQVGTLTLRKLKEMEKEHGLQGTKDGGSGVSTKVGPAEEVRSESEITDLRFFIMGTVMRLAVLVMYFVLDGGDMQHGVREDGVTAVVHAGARP